MTVKRMDNVGIVVDDIDAAIAFFTELDECNFNASRSANKRSNTGAD